MAAASDPHNDIIHILYLLKDLATSQPEDIFSLYQGGSSDLVRSQPQVRPGSGSGRLVLG